MTSWVVISGVAVLSNLLLQPETCSGSQEGIAALDTRTITIAIAIAISALFEEAFAVAIAIAFISSTSSCSDQLVGILAA